MLFWDFACFYSYIIQLFLLVFSTPGTYFSGFCQLPVPSIFVDLYILYYRKKHFSFLSRIFCVSFLQNGLSFFQVLLSFSGCPLKLQKVAILLSNIFLSNSYLLFAFFHATYPLYDILWWCICTLVLCSINTSIGSLMWLR